MTEYAVICISSLGREPLKFAGVLYSTDVVGISLLAEGYLDQFADMQCIGSVLGSGYIIESAEFPNARLWRCIVDWEFQAAFYKGVAEQ